VRQLAGSAGEEHRHRHDELGGDHREERLVQVSVALADGLGDHAGHPEGEHAVGPYPVRRPLDRDDVHEPDDAGLRRGVVRSFGLPEHPRRRRDEDEAPVPLRLHRTKRGLADVEAAVQVDLEHAAPLLDRELVEGRPSEDPCVADERIDPAKRVERGAHHRLTALRRRDRVMGRDGDAAVRLDLLDDLVGDAVVGAFAAHRATEVVDDHGRTAPRQIEGVETTEAAARACDDRDLPGEIDHVQPPIARDRGSFAFLETARKLDGKVAIVTGAGSSGAGVGTGKATALLFAREGAKVVLVDKFEDRANETLALIGDEGGVATVVVADLADMDSCAPVIDEAVRQFGGVDILVNNAAVASSTSLLDTTPELYQQILAVNLTAPFMLTKAAIPVMTERGGGVVLNIISIAALRGQGGSGVAAYAASKSGLIGLMTDVADAYGKQGIRANCIAPGIIKTPMRDNAIRQGGREPSDLDLTYKTSLGIEGDAWDIARAALFLAGPDGRYITGVVLPVDGGSIARSH
jgi:NAD(P)-dependent dehydrogenase (short-subunit alcohol dehydrogenase family)